MRVVKLVVAIILLLAMSMAIACVLVTPGVLRFIGVSWREAINSIPFAIIDAWLFGIPAALPICLIFYWRGWQRYAAWLAAAVASTAILTVVMLLIVRATLHNEASASPIFFFALGYSVPSALIYAWLLKGGWLQKWLGPKRTL